MDIEPLICINPEIMKYKKKYIYGTDNKSIRLFIRLINYRFWVDGFAEDGYDLGNTMLNKQVVTLEDASQEDTVILCWDMPGGLAGNFFDVTQIFILPEDLYENKVVIWGAGKVGKSVCEYLLSRNIHPDCVIDKDVNKQGEILCDVPIVSPAVLLQSQKNTVLIEALANYREVEEEINAFFVKRYKQERVVDADDNIWLVGNQHITLAQINFLENYCNLSELWLYGCCDLVQNYAEVLRLINISVKGYLFDRTDINANYELDEFCSVMMVEEILYIDNPCVLIVDDYLRRMSVLKKMGLLINEQFFLANRMASPFSREDRIYTLDINLGYTYPKQDCYPGMRIYGNNKETDYKIAVLGGSTTDGYLYQFKAWPEYLHDYVKNREVTIYNGGCSGYNSASLLIKLIRDMLTLKPDMIIAYDGVNELSMKIDKNSMLGMLYLEEIFEYANNSRYDVTKREEPYKGIPLSGDRFDKWLYRIEIMHAIAQGFRIPFFVFIQPFLHTKKQLSAKEKKYIRYLEYADEWKKAFSEYPSYIKKIREGKWKNTHPYIYNLTDIFDGEDDIYLDVCHVKERGNKIIADEIYKRIRKLIGTAVE